MREEREREEISRQRERLTEKRGERGVREKRERDRVT